MLPLESLISAPLKAQGFRRKARTWWKTAEATTQVVNLQKSPFGERLYINFGVHARRLSEGSSPAPHKCHVQTRLEQATAEQHWNAIVSAEPDLEPSPERVAAVLRSRLGGRGTTGVARVTTSSRPAVAAPRSRFSRLLRSFDRRFILLLGLRSMWPGLSCQAAQSFGCSMPLGRRRCDVPGDVPDVGQPALVRGRPGGLAGVGLW